jgi:hypothetical protein
MIGLAPEKEFIILKMNYFWFSTNGHCYIDTKRPKVGNNVRVLKLEKILSTYSNYKSIKNYVTKVRPKISNKNANSFFVDPEPVLTGKA